MKSLTKLLAKAILKVVKKLKPSCHTLNNAMKIVRKEIQHEDWYQKPKKKRQIPIMPSMDQLKAFFKAFDNLRDPQYKIWARLVYDAQVRVNELVHVFVKEINLIDRKILIHGKGDKDRVVLISPEIAELLKIHIKSNPGNVFLFENKDNKPFSTRRVQQVFKQARDRAGIDFRMSPHIGRHVGLTHLTRKAFIPIMEQSGHSTGDSLKVYQHLAADQFQPQFDQAMSEFWGAVL